MKRLAVILCGNKRLVLGERGEEAHALRFHVERKVVIPGLLGVERASIDFMPGLQIGPGGRPLWL